MSEREEWGREGRLQIKNGRRHLRFRSALCWSDINTLVACICEQGRGVQDKAQHQAEEAVPLITVLFLWSLLFMIIITIKLRQPPSPFSVPQSSRWAKRSHTVFFLPAHLNVNYSYQFGQIGHMKQKCYLIHKLTLSHCKLHWLQWNRSSNLPCNPDFPIWSLEMYFLLFFLFLTLKCLNWQRGTGESNREHVKSVIGVKEMDL